MPHRMHTLLDKDLGMLIQLLELDIAKGDYVCLEVLDGLSGEIRGHRRTMPDNLPMNASPLCRGVWLLLLACDLRMDDQVVFFQDIVVKIAAERIIANQAGEPSPSFHPWTFDNQDARILH
jgi:hypothetical protein